MNKKIVDYTDVVKKFNKIANRGFSCGIGTVDGQMCVEAAICTAMGQKFGDEPTCVTNAIRNYKIALNDCNWSSPKTRMTGLRKLGIAQLGSKGVITSKQFNLMVRENHIKILIPYFVRLLIPKNKPILELVKKCEKSGNVKDLEKLNDYLYENYYAINAIGIDKLDFLIELTKIAQTLFNCQSVLECINQYKITLSLDKILRILSQTTLEILKKLKSPGCKYLPKSKR